jgi:hypothetical protein
MWVATREGLIVDATGGFFYTVKSDLGNDIQPMAATWATGVDSMVVAQAIFPSNIDISGSEASPNTSFAATIDNVVLMSNNFTIADLSLDITTIFNNLPGAPSNAAAAFIASNSYVITDYFNYGNNIDGTDNPCVTGKLQLNGSDRFQERDGAYFNYVQPWQHFSNTPADGINVYSFALKPEDHQPSGTCNFSRIDNATLQVSLGYQNQQGSQSYFNNTLGGTGSSSLLNIYTVNYNVLRVMSGMAGAAYSN